MLGEVAPLNGSFISRTGHSQWVEDQLDSRGVCGQFQFSFGQKITELNQTNLGSEYTFNFIKYL